MPYITPKTNWTGADGVTDYDMNRIEGNIAELKKAATIELAEAVVSATDVEGALHELGSELVTGKNEIRNSIISMGVALNSTGALSYLAGKIRDISKDATAQPAEVISGKTFYSGGVKKTGTQVLRSAGDYTASLYEPAGNTLRYKVPLSAFYTTDTWITASDPDFIASNIKTGVNIFGVVGTFNSATTASAGDLLDGRTAHSNGSPITGTMPNRSGNEYHIAAGYSINGNNLHFHIPYNGYYSTYNKIWLEEPNWQPNNIRKGTSIFGKTGTMVEGPNFDSSISFTMLGNENMVYINNSGGYAYGFNVRSNANGYYLSKDLLSPPNGTLVSSEILAYLPYPGESSSWGVYVFRETVVLFKFTYDSEAMYGTRIISYTYSGAVVYDTGDISYSSLNGPGQPQLYNGYFTKQGAYVSSNYQYVGVWARNGVPLVNLNMGSNVFIRNQGGGQYSYVRRASWFQIADTKLFAELAVSNSSHNTGALEVTVSTDGMSASATSATWSAVQGGDDNFQNVIIGYVKKYFV